MSDNKGASKETEQPDVAADEIGEFSFFSASTLDEVKEKQAPSRQQGKKRYELFVDGNGKASESSIPTPSAPLILNSVARTDASEVYIKPNEQHTQQAKLKEKKKRKRTVKPKKTLEVPFMPEFDVLPTTNGTEDESYKKEKKRKRRRSNKPEDNTITEKLTGDNLKNKAPKRRNSGDIGSSKSYQCPCGRLFKTSVALGGHRTTCKSASSWKLGSSNRIGKANRAFLEPISTALLLSDLTTRLSCIQRLGWMEPESDHSDEGYKCDSENPEDTYHNYNANKRRLRRKKMGRIDVVKVGHEPDWLRAPQKTSTMSPFYVPNKGQGAFRDVAPPFFETRSYIHVRVAWQAYYDQKCGDLKNEG
eukprot:m.236588 g.236588  ORF g.236588 m.236588 type:complete len:362 (-) comp16051_c0_seq12:1051-2136(-)